MKKFILLALIAVAFAACQKSATTQPKSPVVTKDTIPDNAGVSVRIDKDSTNYDEISLVFNHSAHLIFNNNYDATVISLNPKQSISAISSDGILVNYYTLPYTQGMVVKLAVKAGASGPYFLGLSNLNKIPSAIQIWCRDNYLKDSLNLRVGNYHFNIDNADTNSFGKKRFQIVVR